jgi:hypothetical protein
MLQLGGQPAQAKPPTTPTETEGGEGAKGKQWKRPPTNTRRGPLPAEGTEKKRGHGEEKKGEKGFEPLICKTDTTVFKTGALDRSATRRRLKFLG